VDRLLCQEHSASAGYAVLRKEENSDSNFPLGAEAGIQATGFANEENLRELNRDAGTVTTGSIGVDASTMGQASQALQGLHNHAMRRWLAKLGHKPHPTRVVFLASVEACPTMHP
jgi:hypothetical protein